MASAQRIPKQIVDEKMCVVGIQLILSATIKYHWDDDYCIIQIKFKEDNITIVYNTLSYKLKVMHLKVDTYDLTYQA